MARMRYIGTVEKNGERVCAKCGIRTTVVLLENDAEKMRNTFGECSYHRRLHRPCIGTNCTNIIYIEIPGTNGYSPFDEAEFDK